MAASMYLSLLLIISLIFISHAISLTSSSKLFENICKQPGDKDFEQHCLEVLKPYPEITSAKDYLTFSRLYLKTVAIEKAIKARDQVKEIFNKYHSSHAIKICADNYDTVVLEVKDALLEDPPEISLAVEYAYDALNGCESVLADEKSVNTSSISTLNNEMVFIVEIAGISSGHL
ncbi:PMEI superfamily protein precursor [Trifolium repens]|nr:PMEI superfamily protein precursor [Trifolium repens]